MICLICNEEIAAQASWTSLLLPPENAACDECYQALKKITGATCPSCCRPQETKALCIDCQRWEDDPMWKNILHKNISVFEYNDAVKEVLATFKFRGDAALVNVFQKDFLGIYKNQISSLNIDYAVPIPLSKERLYERGFNQAKLLADFIPIPQLEVLQRTHHEKQSKKSRLERLTASNVFSLTDSSKINNRSFLLIDDIYTTGSTLRHAAKLLIQNGAASVSSLTLIRS
ncbi:ComF family protein [Metabacillus sp. BG109]|uniref:ComF family protein n=2 Tax=Metabacillus bambusae TaxID=2795218 RepID=A0ABS3N0Y9_9BACI|nr:ComF family protein [Metabacillus bambusae]